MRITAANALKYNETCLEHDTRVAEVDCTIKVNRKKLTLHLWLECSMV